MQLNPTPATNVVAEPDKLRVDFIGMAFALAVGEIGLEIGKLYADGVRIRDHWFLLTHTILAVYIIASSWIGWQRSKSAGSLEKIDHTFSIAFLILLFDLLLVICYFIIGQSIGKNPKVPNSRNQIVFSGVIFAVYIFWDFLSKFLNEDASGKITREPDLKKNYYPRAYPAILCFLLSLFGVWPMRDVASSPKVVCVDLLLLFIFILFRGLKFFEHKWRKKGWYVYLPVVGLIIVFLIYIHIK